MQWEYIAPADIADLLPEVAAEGMDPRALLTAGVPSVGWMRSAADRSIGANVATV
jgi:hypothetical protein